MLVKFQSIFSHQNMPLKNSKNNNNNNNKRVTSDRSERLISMLESAAPASGSVELCTVRVTSLVTLNVGKETNENMNRMGKLGSSAHPRKKLNGRVIINNNREKFARWSHRNPLKFLLHETDLSKDPSGCVTILQYHRPSMEKNKLPQK